MDQVGWGLVLDLAKSLGAAAGPIFAILWWLERQERKEVQKEYLALMPQVLTAMSETRSSMGVVGEIVREIRGSLTNLGQTLISASRLHGARDDRR